MSETATKYGNNLESFDMIRFQHFDLTGQIPKAGSIEFLSAEMSATATDSLAIIRYADDGEEQPYGLRLDLDKGVFLDHLDDPEKEEALCSSASAVVSAVVASVSHQEPEN